jgi:G3E family GTPase
MGAVGGGFDMDKTVLILLSGFLGAGKTTLMLSAADHLRAKGINVACVTNDQGEQLVDSKMVLRKEIPLQQIQGGCFCCRFDELVESINQLVSEHHPQVILAEAVGSCTDLVATVIKPLRAFHGDKLDIRPLTVVVDPYRLSELLSQGSSFTEEILYLFQKQMEEAHCILLNKTDLCTNQLVDELRGELKHRYDFAHVLDLSALGGKGVGNWLDYIALHENSDLPNLEIDYDIYAEAEAQLGWLNASFTFDGHITDAAVFCNGLFEEIFSRLKAAEAEVAHFKLWSQDAENNLKISAVRNLGSNLMNHTTSHSWTSERLAVWVNARVNLEPSKLNAIVSQALRSIEQEYRIDISVEQMNCFAPSRPVPAYRFA